MTYKHLTDTGCTDYIRVIGDLHINSSLSEAFEELRLDALVVNLNYIEHRKQVPIILVGDTFDRNTPSLKDIQLFYRFIEKIKQHVYIICGNHDATIFDYIPETSFTYCKEPVIINNNLMLVPWTHLEELQENLLTSSFKQLTLLSHARCTIPPYIQEETSIQQLSKNFKKVLLGDIHRQPLGLPTNVVYTTSPSNISFTKNDSKLHGYIEYNVKEDTEVFVQPNIPYKTLVECKTFMEARKEMMRSHKDMYGVYRKVRFAGTSSEIRELNQFTTINVVKDFTLKITEIATGNTEESDKLAEFLASKLSISQYAFSYFNETLKIPESVTEEMRIRWEQLRTKRRLHK